VRRGLHELADLLHHAGGNPGGHPQGLGLLVLAEQRRSILVAEEPHQVPAHLLAVRLDRIAGRGNAQPHPTECR
jgi:hypothetical protein